ncbi:hypothetical protein [Pararhizobium sp. DWP1-1-3]|uniref:hypothetical protein n=1 Tax=Pararhizobium sp. DWP1-1-3 TaxID=2804652 RepID=UPI003CE9DC48
MYLIQTYIKFEEFPYWLNAVKPGETIYLAENMLVSGGKPRSAQDDRGGDVEQPRMPKERGNQPFALHLPKQLPI